jgi:hypothetical protein
MTEKGVQYLLHQLTMWRKNHTVATPNVSLFGWESDLISVTPAGYAHEFEIKLSKSDYRQDFKNKRYRHQVLGQNGHRRCPAYFWFVIHGFELPITEPPDYAGLIVCEKVQAWRYSDRDEEYQHRLFIEKPAPRISKTKISDRELLELHRALGRRFWAWVGQKEYFFESS